MKAQSAGGHYIAYQEVQTRVHTDAQGRALTDGRSAPKRRPTCDVAIAQTRAWATGDTAALTRERATLAPLPTTDKVRILATGVCYCLNCTASLKNLVQGQGQDRDTEHAETHPRFAHIANTGGVAIPAYTCGQMGKARNAIATRKCLACGDTAFTPTHPSAVRWQCTRCSMTSVDTRWRLSTLQSFL